MAETDPLSALQASLASAREWRNIQQPVMTAVGRIAVALNAQALQIDAMAKRISLLEAERLDSVEKMELLEKTVVTTMQSQAQVVEDKAFTRLESQLRAHASQQQNIIDTLHRQTMQELTRHQSIPPPPPPEDPTVADILGRRLKKLEKQVREVESSVLSQCATWREEIEAELNAKASRVDVDVLLQARASDEEVKRIEAIVRQLREDTVNKPPPPKQQLIQPQQPSPDVSEVKAHVHELLSIVESMQEEQAALRAVTKANTQRVGEQGEAKQAILKLHEAVRGVRRSIESVAKRSEIEALNEQVGWIRKQLRSELFQARYIWKEGKPTSKQLIAWNSQAINTNADVFVWQPNRPDVTSTMIPGLYHLQAAFFTSSTPTLQVYVNGEPALILHTLSDGSQPDSELAVHYRRRLHHSAGDIVGVEITAYLALPARAAVSIGYDLDECAQGFLNLRKL